MGRPKKGELPPGRDPVKKFRCSRWVGINRRTINGTHPNWKNPGTKRFLENGVQLKMKKEEFYSWCEEHRELLIDFERRGIAPSIDRIDSWGHYELSNLRIIPLNLNKLEGAKVKSERLTRKLNALPTKHCEYCKATLTRHLRSGRDAEPSPKFKRRRFCNKGCSRKARGNLWTYKERKQQESLV